VSWKDHMTNEELLQKAGVGDLQDTVSTRRRRFMGHCASRCQDQPACYLTGLQREEEEDGAGQSGHGAIHLQRICERWVSVAVAFMMRLEVLPVIVPDGDNSSPSVPDGTGGPKSK